MDSLRDDRPGIVVSHYMGRAYSYKVTSSDGLSFWPIYSMALYDFLDVILRRTTRARARGRDGSSEAAVGAAGEGH